VLVAVLVSGSGPLAGQDKPSDGQTTFRTEASFVLTDVLVTKDGKPVLDLTQADFELREDGTAQTIRSFEHVRLDRTAAAVERRSPSTVAESRAVAGDPRRRVFVLFLDTFHVTRAAGMDIRQTLVDFASKLVGPDDLIALMTPQMSGGDISFATTPDAITGYFAANVLWGVQDEPLGAETDPVEKNLATCFSTPKQMEDWARIRARMREHRTLTTLQSLVAHLEGLRESRKAVIVVTEGWQLFGEDPTKLTDSEQPQRAPGLQPVGVGPDGQLGFTNRNREGGVSNYNCDTLRMHTAQSETRNLFRQIIGEANRANASFYTVDAARLRAGPQRRITTGGLDTLVESRQRDHEPFGSALDTIRTFGEATGGLAIVDSNDLRGGLQNVVDDLGSYYLLGYNSTNGKSDGRYRKIRVTVKRPGVEVRAREGYFARKPSEMPREKVPGETRPVTSDESMVTSALARLPSERRTAPLMLYAAMKAPAGSASPIVSVVAEVERAILNTPEWREGADVEATVRLANGETAASAKARLDAGASVIRLDVPLPSPPASEDLKVQVRLVGVGTLARFTDTTVVRRATTGVAWGAPLVLRRGPSTGIAWVPTADMRFRRQERLRVEIAGGEGAALDALEGALVDRRGNRMAVPVRVEAPAEGRPLTADVTLAPLAAGDYVILVQQGEARVTIPLRIVP
jgi:VWFA-related protein